MKVKMHSQYDHFPNHVPMDDEPFIHCYNDGKIYEDIEPNSIALMIEPRSLQAENYRWMEDNYSKFRYVFTHDSQLLATIPNAKLILYGGVRGWSDIEKTKYISMVSSDKDWCPLHKARKNLALEFNGVIDCYGTFNGGPFILPEESYAPYMFSVVMENYIDDYWFTEKICTCFANKTIPIYLGAKKIDDFFCSDGIFHAQSVEHLKEMIMRIKCLGPDGITRLYNDFKHYVDLNYAKVQSYSDFENWFFNEYGDLLEGMLND